MTPAGRRRARRRAAPGRVTPAGLGAPGARLPSRRPRRDRRRSRPATARRPPVRRRGHRGTRTGRPGGGRRRAGRSPAPGAGGSPCRRSAAWPAAPHVRPGSSAGRPRFQRHARTTARARARLPASSATSTSPTARRKTWGTTRSRWLPGVAVEHGQQLVAPLQFLERDRAPVVVGCRPAPAARRSARVGRRRRLRTAVPVGARLRGRRPARSPVRRRSRPRSAAVASAGQERGLDGALAPEASSSRCRTRASGATMMRAPTTWARQHRSRSSPMATMAGS